MMHIVIDQTEQTQQIRQPDIKCPRGEKATYFCLNKMCTAKIIMCSSQNCICKFRHKQCLNKTPIKNIIQNLKDKQRSFVPVLESIREQYKNWVRHLSQALFQIGKMIQKSKIQLIGSENTLQSLIDNEEFDAIDFKLLFNVIQSLKQEPKIKFDNLIEKNNKDLKIINEKMLCIMRNVKQAQHYLTVQKLCEMPTLLSEYYHSSDLLVIGSRIKSINTSKRKIFALKDSIETFNSNFVQEYTFKINKINNNSIGIGFFHKSSIEENYKLKTPRLSTGSIENMLKNYNKQNSIKKKKAQFNEGDLFTLIHNPNTKQVYFYIKNKDKFVQSDPQTINYIPGNLLYPCIFFNHVDDEVQFKGLRLYNL